MMKRGTIITYDVYVANFAKTLTAEAIEKKVSKQFTQFGETKGIFIRDNNQGKYGVVKYLSEPDADKAVSESNGLLMDGVPLLVRRMERRTQQNKPAGGAAGSAVVTGGTWVATKDGSQKNQFGKNPDIVPAVEPAGSSSPGPEGEGSAAPASWASRLPGSVTMMVTFIETPTLLWCQDLTLTSQNEVELIAAKLAEVCPTAPKLQGRPELGKIYGGQFSEDGEWYRCQLKMNISGNQEKVKIQYIDFGNCEDVNFKELVELPSELTAFKPHAQKIMLHNTRYLGPKEREARQYLEGLIYQQSVVVNPTFRLPDGSGQFAQIYTEASGSLSQDLIDRGFAAVKPPKQQQPSPQPPSGDSSLTSSFHMGEGGGYSLPGSRGPGGGGGGGMNPPGRQLVGEQDPSWNPSARFGGSNSGRGGLPKLGGGDKGSLLSDPSGSTGPAYSDLMIDIKNKHRTLEKASAELAAERNKLKNLQQEFQGMVARMEENNIVSQLTMAARLSSQVRQLRNQFSCEQPTAIDEAIELACSEKKLTESSLSCLPPLLETISTYRSLQQTLSRQDLKQEQCTEKVEERDAIRKTLHSQLTECITEMESFPFTERAQNLSQCREKLLKHYDNYFKLPVDPFPDFRTAVEQYQELKAKKKTDFEHTQQCSDKQQDVVQTQLAAIGKNLSLAAEDETTECDLDLLKQMQQYCGCLQQEIATRNVEATQDGSFLASLIKSVHHDLEAESLCVNKFVRLQTDFQNMRKSIEPWLESKPSMDKLLENRQTLKSLKSKLRHKLADKHDAEENEDSEELAEIQKEVESIQTEIHNTLLTEQSELSTLSSETDNHFPEYLCLHPDLGLDLQLKYKGIVKNHHEISHYNLTPVPGARGRLFYSKFADKDIIVMECLLSDGHHMGHDYFLSQMSAFVSISHPALLPPTTIFFDKKYRHVYVCVERGDGEILDNYIQQHGAVSYTESQVVMKSVTEGVEALHNKKILHGEINPSSILRHADGTASLLPPDFSCRPVDRAKNKYTTANGLNFTAPELSSIPAGVEPTGVVDMYNMGLLIVYLLHGKDSLPFTADGFLDVGQLQLETPASNVVKVLLSQHPPLRPTADLLLASGFLRQPQHGMASDSADLSSAAATAAVLSTMSNVMPTFSMSSSHHHLPHPNAPSPLPILPPVNLQQPPPPLPNPFPCVQQEPGFPGAQQETGFPGVQQEPGFSGIQQDFACVQQDPGFPIVQQEPGFSGIQQEPGFSGIKQEPSFTHGKLQEPSFPGVQQEASFSGIQLEGSFVTPPPMDFSTPPPADTLAAGDTNGSSNHGQNPPSFPPAAEQPSFEMPVTGFEAQAPPFLPASSGGFEEAALQQEQQEIENRGPMSAYMPGPEQGFGGSGGQFEIGTFSIEDVNGGSDGLKGRKITRQLSAEDGNEAEGEEWTNKGD